jgi:hypothetical protein
VTPVIWTGAPILAKVTELVAAGFCNNPGETVVIELVSAVTVQVKLLLTCWPAPVAWTYPVIV